MLLVCNLLQVLLGDADPMHDTILHRWGFHLHTMGWLVQLSIKLITLEIALRQINTLVHKAREFIMSQEDFSLLIYDWIHLSICLHHLQFSSLLFNLLLKLFLLMCNHL